MHVYKCNVVADLKHAPPHMCYHAKFGRSALKGVGINTGEPPKLGRHGTSLFLDMRRGKPQDTPSPYVLPSNLVVLR